MLRNNHMTKEFAWYALSRRAFAATHTQLLELLDVGSGVHMTMAIFFYITASGIE